MQEIINNIEIKKNQTGGAKKHTKKIRKHRGIYQKGKKAGQLKPGFYYTGKKTKTGLKIIAEKSK